MTAAIPKTLAKVPEISLLRWTTLIATTTVGTTLTAFADRSPGIGFGRYWSSAALFLLIVTRIVLFQQQAAKAAN